MKTFHATKTLYLAADDFATTFHPDPMRLAQAGKPRLTSRR